MRKFPPMSLPCPLFLLSDAADGFTGKGFRLWPLSFRLSQLSADRTHGTQTTGCISFRLASEQRWRPDKSPPPVFLEYGLFLVLSPLQSRIQNAKLFSFFLAIGDRSCFGGSFRSLRCWCFGGRCRRFRGFGGWSGGLFSRCRRNCLFRLGFRSCTSAS
jgi:hypothetical protein